MSPSSASRDRCSLIAELPRGTCRTPGYCDWQRFASAGSHSDEQPAVLRLPAEPHTGIFREESAMKLPRRRFLHLAVGAAALPALSRVASAEIYPSRPVHWIVSFAAGGPNDVVARIVGQYLSEHLGQQFVIENRAGAGGNVGMQSALNSAPDGYTIVFVGPNYAVHPALYQKLPFDFLRLR